MTTNSSLTLWVVSTKNSKFSQGSGVIAEERAERIRKLEVVEHYYEPLFSRLDRDIVHMNSQKLPCKVKVDKIAARNGGGHKILPLAKELLAIRERWTLSVCERGRVCFLQRCGP